MYGVCKRQKRIRYNKTKTLTQHICIYAPEYKGVEFNYLMIQVMDYPDLTFFALAADFQEQLAIQSSVEEEILWGSDDDD